MALTPAEKQKAYRERQAAARLKEREAKNIPAAPPIPTVPAKPRWDALIAQAIALLETCHNEMQAYFDERTEQWQEDDRGEALTGRIEAIERAIAELEDGAA